MEHIKVTSLTKHFSGGHAALSNIDLCIAPGEMVALIGASGSGKSTLLRTLSGLERADRVPGKCAVHAAGGTVQRGGALAPGIRRTRGRIGFIFQQFNLVGRLSVQTNVLVGALSRLPLWRTMTMAFPQQERELALRALQRVGIVDQAYKRASDLSGGQQQRAAIARALVQQAEVILADEPIASLDPESSRRVMESLATINREDGITVVVSLHQVDFALRYCPRLVALKRGRVVYDGPSSEVNPALLEDIYDAEPSGIRGLGGLQAAASQGGLGSPLLEAGAASG